ncbi:hypothetical protein SOVF_072700 [Spinacia oleracea]|nr:hypothetical protein SOVF_072700 [Spinacia oleracea]
MALYSSLNSSNALVQCSRQNSNIQSSFLVRPFSFPVRSPPNTVSLLISHSSSAPTSEICLPDPIPEFAEAETQKFKIELKTTLLKDEDALGDELDRVVDVCAKRQLSKSAVQSSQEWRLGLESSHKEPATP